VRLFYLVAAMFAAGSAAWAVDRVEVLFFVSTDCPISNSFAPEIQRICRDYAAKGVGCSLIYEDFRVDAAAVRKHRADYGYDRISTVIDTDRRAARKAHATITPQAVVIDSGNKIRYRGRINNFYADLGKPRRVVTVHDVRDALNAVLAGRPVANPETRALGCYIVPPDIQRRQK
jgi:hypothetical protein